jgi:NADH-quinone oxidoreductase subunit D
MAEDPADRMAGDPTERVVAVGAGAVEAADEVLSLGFTHPSSTGVLRLRLSTEGDRIVRADPVVGYLHRGAEKLFEVRDYRQVLVLANRHDWLSSFANEIGICLAVERMLGVAVPARATWARTLLAEVNRVLAALAFLGAAGDLAADLAAPTAPAYAAHTAREALQAVLEEVSGGRVHYMLNQVGGLKQDIPAGWPDRTRAALGTVRALLPEVAAPVTDSEAFRAATSGIGVLAGATALAYGASGPVGRASGLDLDLRRDDPYLAYGELGFGGPPYPVVVGTDGDCLTRFRCLLDQVPVSLDLAAACLDRLAELPPGPIAARLPTTVRAPEGATYTWTENPLGIAGTYLVSRGDPTPWRLHLRTASFNHVQLLAELLPGLRVEDLVPLLSSLFYVLGDLDK